MTVCRLRLSISRRELQHLPPTDFVWQPPPASSSFRTDLAPGCEQFHGARRVNVEFVRLAVLAYLVDRTTPRPNRGWLRHLDLHVPVWDPEPWVQIAEALAGLLGFLTCDQWRLAFYRARTPRAPEVGPTLAGPVVSLFSGGADSLAGAIITRAELDEAPVLVSHRDSGAQGRLIHELAAIWGIHPAWVPVTIGKKKTQIGSGESFGTEWSSRSRSLLFVSLGLAVASGLRVPLRIAENGFASINPPMGGERRGALSTRTTHPWYLWRLRELLEQVGAHAAIENPSVGETKGQMFQRVARLIGPEEASRLLSASHSCARGGDRRFAGVAGAHHCGVCFGCLVRRAAFLSSGLADQTVYVVGDLATPVASPAHGWYTGKRASDLQAVRFAVSRGVDPGEITRILPPNTDATAAVDVARRGLAELGALVL